MPGRTITPDMIRPGATFNLLCRGGNLIGKRIVVQVVHGVFILISENYIGTLTGHLNGLHAADSLAAEMTRMDAYEPVLS